MDFDVATYCVEHVAPSPINFKEPLEAEIKFRVTMKQVRLLVTIDQDNTLRYFFSNTLVLPGGPASHSKK